MKTVRILSLALILGALAVSSGLAQKSDTRIDRLVSRLTEKLALTQDQRARIGEILRSSDAQAKADRDANKGNRILLTRAARMRMQKLDKDLAEVLTDDQRKAHPGINREIHRFMLEPAEGGHRKRE